MSRLNEGYIPLDLGTKENMEISGRLAWHLPASPAAVASVLSQSPDDEDGRSEFLWIRLANGDLILGVFPQGDTYYEFEEEHSV